MKTTYLYVVFYVLKELTCACSNSKNSIELKWKV